MCQFNLLIEKNEGISTQKYNSLAQLNAHYRSDMSAIQTKDHRTFVPVNLCLHSTITNFGSVAVAY